MKSIVYKIRTDEQTIITVPLQFTATTFELVHDSRSEWPDWTRLEHNQCSHCPLSNDHHPHCPAAISLTPILEATSGLISYQPVEVTVIEENRTTTRIITAQDCLRSLLGLVFPTSGCPHTATFKPMARFHLPFSDQQETLYRVSSMYLLAQYVRSLKGQPHDFALEGIEVIYQRINIVNHHMVERLHPISRKDSSLNAISILDVFAQMLPMAKDDMLEELSGLFEAFF